MTDPIASAGQPTIGQGPTRRPVFLHGLAVVLFGIVIPILVLSQAYSGLTSLRSTVTADMNASAPIKTMSAAAPALKTGNDYALFSVLAAEHTNEAVVINKQVMKVVIIQVGFAVISLGMMLVVLGINDGGGVLGLGALKFDLKTGSTGVLVFVVGAGMATAGGVLKNDYNTVPIPNFVYGGAVDTNDQAKQLLQACREQAGADAAACFKNSFEHYVEGSNP